MIQLIRSLPVLAAAAALAGCVGSGEKIVERRAVAAFDGLEISGSADVRVVHGEPAAVRVTGDDNLVPRTETAVIDGTLHIRSPRPAVQDLPLVVEIVSPELRRIGVSLAGDVEIDLAGAPLEALGIDLDGAGRLVIHDLRAGALDITVDGAGNLTASGRVEHLRFDLDGVGAAKLGELCARTAEVSVSGAGKVTVIAAERVEADLSGAAVLRYAAPHTLPEPDGPSRVERTGDGSLCAD